jgi:hypothetical protein
MTKKTNTQTRPPAPEHLAVTFAVSQLEDSPLDYVLITWEEDPNASDEASVAIDMRVANQATLEMMVEKLLGAIQALNKKK